MIKKLIFLSLALSLFGCAKTKMAKVPGYPFSISIPERQTNFEQISADDLSYSAYMDGFRTILRSMTSEEFLMALSKNTDNLYYEIRFYREQNTEDFQNWIIQNCPEASVDRAIESKKFSLYKFKKCRSTDFIILHDSKMYRIREGDDSRDHERVWEILKTIQFDE